MSDYIRFLCQAQDDARAELLRIGILAGLALVALLLVATTLYALTAQ